MRGKSMTREQYFLGQCLWEPSIVWETKVTPDDFSESYNRNLFSSMLDITREGKVIDESTLSERSGVSISEVMNLKSTDILASNWRFNEGHIRKSSAIRRIKSTAQEILESKDHSPSDLIAMMQSSIDNIQEAHDSFGITLLQDDIEQSLDLISKRIKERGQLVGIPSGIKELDKITGGFQNRRLYYIGARPSQGKTALLVNSIKSCHSTCGVLSAESGKQEILNRLLSNESNIDSQRLVFGLFKSGEIERLQDAVESLKNRKDIYIYDEPNMSIDTAVSVARQMKRRFNIKALFVDYLQILSTPRGGQSKDYREHISNASRQMKQLARTLDIPVVVAAQLRRDAEGNRPKLSDFSESTQIERDADVAIMIHNRYKEGTLHDSWLIVEKNRDGRKGDIPVIFDQSHIRFYDR